MAIIKTLFITLLSSILLFLLSTIIAKNCNASELDGFKLDELSINYKRFIGETRHPLFLNSKQKEEVDLNFNTTILNYMFWDNTIHSMTDDSQYKIVGWNLKIGVRLFDNLDFQAEHFSKHLLDETYSVMRFPVENSIGFKWTLYKDNKKKESIFK